MKNGRFIARVTLIADTVNTISRGKCGALSTMTADCPMKSVLMERKDSMLISHIDYAVADDCINIASYGVVCVKCNACGRFNKETQRECALRMWMDELYNQFHFNAWFDDEGIKALQKKNIESNIEFIQDKILSLLFEAIKEG